MTGTEDSHDLLPMC